MKLVADALEEDLRATCEELSRPTGTQKLRRKMHKNRSQLLVAGPLILRDNARAHIADVVTKKLRDYGSLHCTLQSGYESTKLRLIPKVKKPMRGRSFSSLEELSTDGTRAIRHTNKSGVLDGIIMLLKRLDSVTEKLTK